MVIPSHEYPQRTYLLSLFLSFSILRLSTHAEGIEERAFLSRLRVKARSVADTRHLSHSIKAWGESLALSLSLFPSPIPAGFENVIRLKLVIKNRWRE